MAVMAPASTSSFRAWEVKEIRSLVQAKFNKRPCWLQIKIAIDLYAGKDVVGFASAATGTRKTLPLNLLGKRNVRGLGEGRLECSCCEHDECNDRDFHSEYPHQLEVFYHDSYLFVRE